MLILDAIVFNEDRHKRNYGFIYDNDCALGSLMIRVLMII